MELIIDVALDLQEGLNMKRVFLAMLIWVIASIPGFCATAVLDIAQKTLTCDLPTIDCKAPHFDGEQICLYIINKSMQSQDFYLKAKGLKSQDYDIYVYGSYLGKRSSGQLSEGIKMNIPGTVGVPDCMRCLNALKDNIKPEIDRLAPLKDNESQRVLWTLRQADDWVQSGLRLEAAYRSLDMIISPEDMVLKKVSVRSRADADGTVKAIYSACELLQHARSRMYEKITDPVLRNRAVEVMTPVTFTPVYQMKDGKPYVTAVVVNDCNLPISGDITFALPKGWKTDAKQLYFNNLESGQTYKTTFTLIAPSETDAAPQELPIAANISLNEGKFEAKLKLRVVQMLGS